MIQITNIETYGWEAAIRGMRNPMNSWEKSDSKPCYILKDLTLKNYEYRCAGCKNEFTTRPRCLLIGPEDFKLMLKLAKAGSDHAKYRRMIGVTMNILAPLYWWKEFDTYKVGTVANSCSTMHKIAEREFTLDDFSHEHLSNFSSHPDKVIDPISILESTIKTLNACRDCYLLEDHDKYFWWQMIQLLPSSYNQLRTVQLNYEVLTNIYHSRKDHKLDEWRDFCKMIENLPYSEIISMEG